MVTDEARGVVASPDRVAAWLLCARPGDEFVYATRCILPVAAPGAIAARDAFDRGLVQLFQRRIEGSSERNYIARRTRVALPVDGTPAPLPVPANDVPHVDSEARAINDVLRLLRKSARFTRPCPTDAMIARRVGVTRGEVARVMQVMERMNLIRVARVQAPTMRQVTIVATGHRTGMIG